MRTSLLVGLAQAASNALRRQVTSVRLFELGKSFHPLQSGKGMLPEERKMLGLILAGVSSDWVGGDRRYDFYDAKGVIESILSPMVDSIEFVADGRALEEASFLHPKRRASIGIPESIIGCLGELHPDVVDALELQGQSAYIEIDVDALERSIAAQPTAQAHALPKFPAVTRDIAMLVGNEHAAGAIALALKDAADGMAESVAIFDLYEGDQIPHGQRSLAFRVVYRDPEATLTDKKVQSVHQKVVKAAQTQFSATIR